MLLLMHTEYTGDTCTHTLYTTTFKHLSALQKYHRTSNRVKIVFPQMSCSLLEKIVGLQNFWPQWVNFLFFPLDYLETEHTYLAHNHIPTSICLPKIPHELAIRFSLFFFKLIMFFVGENSRFAELLAAMGELSILSPGLPGEGSQAPVRSPRPITGRLTKFFTQFRPISVSDPDP